MHSYRSKDKDKFSQIPSAYFILLNLALEYTRCLRGQINISEQVWDEYLQKKRKNSRRSIRRLFIKLSAWNSSATSEIGDRSVQVSSTKYYTLGCDVFLGFRERMHEVSCGQVRVLNPSFQN